MSWPSKKGGVPSRWLDYSAVGKRLEGTRFIAFKVPLKQSLNQHLPDADVFGPWELLDALNKENQELGLIIDLTNTKRYYSLQDIPESLLVVKILTAGHEIPSDKTILSFKCAVRSFLQDNAENDQLIGVHCTHGLNRTGYLMCRYLIDVDGMDPKEALELFNSSRGHAVERQNYLDDLQFGPKRSNKGMEMAEEEPKRGLASQRPSSTPSDSDIREDRRSHLTDTRNHSRPFPSRGTNQRSHRHHPHDGLPSPPVGAPLLPHQWMAPHADSQWRRPPHSEDSRSRYPPPEDSRSRYPPPEDNRSRYPPPEDSRSRYPPPEDSRSRYPPPEDSRSRYPPPEDSRSRYPPPEDSRSRYPPPEDSRSRYPPPEDSRSRYLPPADSRSRYPPPEDSRSRYLPPEDSRSRYAPQEERTRYPPLEVRRSKHPPPEKRSKQPPPPEKRSKQPPPPERSRHPPPPERSRHPPPPERSRHPPERSRHPPPPERRSTYAPPEQRMSTYAPPEQRKSTYAPPEQRKSTYAPPEVRRIGPPPLPSYSPHWTKESIG